MSFRTFLAGVCLLFSASAHADVDELMEVSGLAQSVERLPQQVSEMWGNSAADGVASSTAIARALEDQAVLTTMAAALNAELDDATMDQLLDWYRTPLAVRITDLELAAQEPEHAERVAAQVDSLLTDPRTPLMRRIEKASGTTEAAVDMALSLQTALLDTLLDEVQIEDRDSVREQAREALLASMTEMRQFAVAGLVYTYETLTDAELETYAQVLESSAMQAFLKLTVSVLQAEMVDAMRVAGREWASELPDQSETSGV